MRQKSISESMRKRDKALEVKVTILDFCNQFMKQAVRNSKQVGKRSKLQNHASLSLSQNFNCMKSAQIRSFFWSVFSQTLTEYGYLWSKYPYSVRARENTDQKKLHAMMKKKINF